MIKEFNISLGTIRVVGGRSNVDVYFWKKDNLTEADSHFTIFADNCRDFTTEENLEDFLENLKYQVTLTEDDEKRIKEEMFSFIIPMSKQEG